MEALIIIATVVGVYLLGVIFGIIRTNGSTSWGNIKYNFRGKATLWIGLIMAAAIAFALTFLINL